MRQMWGAWARWCAAIALAVGTAGLIAPAAQAYPATVCSASVSPRHATGGTPITVKAKANKPVGWTAKLTAKGARTQTARGHGKTFTHVFSTKKVSSKVSYDVAVACSGGGAQHHRGILAPADTNNGGGHNGTAGQGGPSSGGNGILPNTGGPSLWLALLALGLLIGGTVTLRRRRLRE